MVGQRRGRHHRRTSNFLYCTNEEQNRYRQAYGFFHAERDARRAKRGYRSYHRYGPGRIIGKELTRKWCLL